MQVGVLGVQSSLRGILTENMAEFKSLAEKTAREGGFGRSSSSGGGGAAKEAFSSTSGKASSQSKTHPAVQDADASNTTQQQSPLPSQQPGLGSLNGRSAQSRRQAPAAGVEGEQGRRGSPPHRTAAAGRYASPTNSWVLHVWQLLPDSADASDRPAWSVPCREHCA